MFLLSFRRRKVYKLAIRASLFLALFFSFGEILHVRRAQDIALLTADTFPQTSYTPRRLFITSIHWNNEKVLRERWDDALIEIVRYFGPENVYISIYESGSWDDSKGALRELQAKLQDLQVNNTIILDPTTHQEHIANPPTEDIDDDGWIKTPRGQNELRRIPYLAAIRNHALKPLYSLPLPSETSTQTPSIFDTILFLNDVYFSLDQVLTLLQTNDGDYAAACSLDFSKPPQFYDTFALRDVGGDPAISRTWPYFRHPKTSSKVISNSDSVPVSSCWNGMVAMAAEPFYDKENPLRFRGIPDSLAEYHLEGSECCLIHADNPVTSQKGVYLNFRVRVGYNAEAWEAVKGTNWLSASEILIGLWKNRMQRLFTTHWFTKRIVNQRMKDYTAKTGHIEHARQCLINEMQVLVWNGWAHV